MKKISFIIFFCLITTMVMGQSDTLRLEDIAKKHSTANRIYIKKNIDLNIKTLFEDFKKDFGLSDNDSIGLKVVVPPSKACPNCLTHKYLQYYKGVPVMGTTHHVNILNDRVKSITLRTVKGLNLDVAPKLSVTEASEIAFKHLGVPEKHRRTPIPYIDEYDEVEQENAEEKTEEKDGFSAPTYALGIVHPNTRTNEGRENAEEYQLTYRFVIFVTASTNGSKFGPHHIFVNAHTGEIVISSHAVYHF